MEHYLPHRSKRCKPLSTSTAKSITVPVMVLPMDSLVERELKIETTEGSMATFAVYSDTAKPSPVVLFFMDAVGKRPLLHDMARRWATHGYYVLLPNLYYRTTSSFQLDFSSRESFKEMTKLMHGVGNKMVARDTAVLLDYVDSDPAADGDHVGCVGYCMSGPFVLYAAAEHAARIGAAASIYGTRLAVDAADSPHRRLHEIRGEIYVACAEHDDYAPPEMVDHFEKAMTESSVRGRLERYPGTQHGFAFDDRPAYDATADKRHWEALFDLFERTLQAGNEDA